MTHQPYKDGVLYIGDAVIDQYEWGGQLGLRAGGIGNVLSAVGEFDSADFAITAHPNPKALASLITSTTRNLQMEVFPLNAPAANIVSFRVRSGVTEIMDDNPAPGEVEISEYVIKILREKHFSRIVVSDYGLGVLNKSLILKLADHAIHHNIEIFVDCRHSNFDDYIGATVLFPNQQELSSYIKTDRFGSCESAKQLAQLTNAKKVIAKHGDKGCLYWSADCSFFVSASEFFVADTFGAGDTILGLASREAELGTKESISQVVLGTERRLRLIGGGVINWTCVAAA